ncbi:uncharacterized protein SCHCODRAFT_02574246, partial [Schizophyllum commune H4-8]|uniref:uncharacterized protein n=1 Tax=Schizophyllum commune (strain H4-8 / FGSC 9210) TaxID=578458 RepID=UPI002160D889
MDTLPIGGEVEPVGRARAPGLPIFQLFYLYPGVRYALSLRSTGELKWGFGDPHELVDFGTFHDPDHVCENIQRNMEADLRRILADARAGYPTAHKPSTLPNGQPIVMSTAPGFIPVVAQLYATAPIPFLSHSLIFEYAHAPTICYNYRRPSTLPLF